MSDIVDRLRAGTTDGSHLRWTVTTIHLEAADDIERLRANPLHRPHLLHNGCSLGNGKGWLLEKSQQKTSRPADFIERKTEA